MKYICGILLLVIGNSFRNWLDDAFRLGACLGTPLAYPVVYSQEMNEPTQTVIKAVIDHFKGEETEAHGRGQIQNRIPGKFPWRKSDTDPFPSSYSSGGVS
jgi:hypothetical protein